MSILYVALLFCRIAVLQDCGSPCCGILSSNRDKHEDTRIFREHGFRFLCTCAAVTALTIIYLYECDQQGLVYHVPFLKEIHVKIFKTAGAQLMVSNFWNNAFGKKFEHHIMRQFPTLDSTFAALLTRVEFFCTYGLAFALQFVKRSWKRESF